MELQKPQSSQHNTESVGGGKGAHLLTLEMSGVYKTKGKKELCIITEL